MSRTVRIYIDLDEQQAEALRRRAAALGISEQELLLRGAATEAKRLSDAEEAWNEHLALVKERMALDVPQTGRDWTREDLYDE